MQDLIELNPDLRILTSSTNRFNFKHFSDPENPGIPKGECHSFCPIHCRHDFKPESENKKEKKPKDNHHFGTIRLVRLSYDDAVNLILSSCSKEISREELDLDEEDCMTIHDFIKSSKILQAIDGRPSLLIEVARAIENLPLKELELIKKYNSTEKCWEDVIV